MSVTPFKDFNKETKDLLTKNYMGAGKWKLESKVKGGNDQLFINPAATNEGITVDVEYKASAQPIAVKTTFSPSALKKTTVTFTDKVYGKFEVATDAKFDAPEFSYESVFKGVSVHEKLTKKASEAFLAFSPIPVLSLGASANYTFDTKAVKTSLGARYSCKECGLVANATTNDFKAFTVGAIYNVALNEIKGQVAAQVDYSKNATKIALGGETGCLFFKSNAIRVRVDSDKNITAAYIAKLKSWTAAITVHQNLKFGATFTLQ